MLNASRIISNIAAVALDGGDLPPANSQDIVLSGLQDAQNALNTINESLDISPYVPPSICLRLVFTNANDHLDRARANNTANLQQANSFVTQAIVTAQHAVDLNCTLIDSGPSASLSNANVPAATAAFVSGQPYGSFSG